MPCEQVHTRMTRWKQYFGTILQKWDY